MARHSNRCRRTVLVPTMVVPGRGPSLEAELRGFVFQVVSDRVSESGSLGGSLRGGEISEDRSLRGLGGEFVGGDLTRRGGGGHWAGECLRWEVGSGRVWKRGPGGGAHRGWDSALVS